MFVNVELNLLIEENLFHNKNMYTYFYMINEYLNNQDYY